MNKKQAMELIGACTQVEMAKLLAMSYSRIRVWPSRGDLPTYARDRVAGYLLTKKNAAAKPVVRTPAKRCRTAGGAKK